MADTFVDPALFRLRVFEVEWLEPLKAELDDLYDGSAEVTLTGDGTAESDGTAQLLHVLVAEAERWLTIGQQVGYFAPISPSAYPLSTPEPPELQWLLSTIRLQTELPSNLGVREFARALSEARDDLTVHRREFLRLAIFAEDEEWLERLNQIRSLAEVLTDWPEEFSLSEIADRVTWGLDDFEWDISNPSHVSAETGGASPEKSVRVGLQRHLPAEWRSGSLTLVAKQSPITTRRLAALTETRAAIAVTMQRFTQGERSTHRRDSGRNTELQPRIEMASELPTKGRQVRVDGALVTVRDADWAGDGAVELFVLDANGRPRRILLSEQQLVAGLVPINDRGGNPERALTGLWGRWMQHAVPRIRSAVLATRPLRPYAHQDDAVHGHMLNQPRLRFLLGDEPGTGKTIMAGMYLTEGRRQGLVQGESVIIVPAHLATKWERDLRRLFGVEARRITNEVAADPADLDPRYDTWIVSIDLFTHNPDVRRKVAGHRASWSLAIFDEAHRLTPTSQYLAAARDVAGCAHHLLLLTATPHRGKENYFRGLMNLLDPTLYPWDPRQTEYATALVPSKLSFLRRMKENLIDHDGDKLFPPRFSETVSVQLNPYEAAAYDATMDYVGAFYADNATLARSIYGKRAASSLHAAATTISRRQAALRGAAHERGTMVVPDDLISPSGLGVAADDDEAWTQAENALVTVRTTDKSGELARVATVLETLHQAEEAATPAKWTELLKILQRHNINPRHGQVLVFTEFADTARWLRTRFNDAGFSTDVLEGAIDHRARDSLQERFLAGAFQVLVSTDAGGEGIDLQSANVMIDWDLPWSMVRLEQRMGRLHRVGQRNAVHVYHLVAPHTREGRVQEVMLKNLESAADALDGKLYDLLDATAVRAGFDWGKAMVDAQAGRQVTIPESAALIETARALVADERSLSTPSNVAEALERFAVDRLEAINPVIADALVDQLAHSGGWTVGPGPAKGIRLLRARVDDTLPDALGGQGQCYIAADGASVRQAINDGATGLDDVIVLGPTEEPFQQLVAHALSVGEEDLVRGAALLDSASLTSYVLALFDADIQLHDGTVRANRKAPLLIRCSAGNALPVAWESLMTLGAPAPEHPAPAGPTSLPPATMHDATEAAKAELRTQVTALTAERQAWIKAAKVQLDATQYRFEESIADRPVSERAGLLNQFTTAKTRRLAVLDDIAQVNASAVRLVGWVAVTGSARVDQLGYDPDAEKVAIATVVTELENSGYDVDNRQTAGLGYDLYARHRTTREQRLVEVKGIKESLRGVWLEQNEWAQAQQRANECWLYVVDSCATTPVVRLRQQDPAAVLGGPRRIERFQISLPELNRLIGVQA